MAAVIRDSATGKRAVVIGGTSGFGLVTARMLGERGARVLVTGRSAEGLRAAAALDGVTAIRSDATDAEDLAALPPAVEAALGGIDLLFLNAGVNLFRSFRATTQDDWDRLMSVNARGPYFTVQGLLPLMGPGSAIVLTTSVADAKGLSDVSVYAASKAALRSITRTLARELAPSGIRVNAVTPGPIDTGILERSVPPEALEATRAGMIANNPMGRFGREDEVARAVLFLGFDATYTTGAELPVDGGVSQL